MRLVSLSITAPHLPDVLYCHSAYEAAEGIDARVGAVPRAATRPAPGGDDAAGDCQSG